MNKNPQRIMIFGRPGSGKSTCALRLSKMLNLPVYHLDKIFFESHWQERNYQQFLQLQQKWVEQDQWIIDGNNSKSFEMRYSRADTVIYLNYPRLTCYYRVFKRLFNKDPNIDDRADYCHETVRWSLLKYMWGFEQHIAECITTLKQKYPKKNFLEIRNNDALSALYTKAEAF